MQTKQEFSSFISKLFENETIKNKIAEYAAKEEYKERVLGIILGDILTFYTVTRSSNTSPTLINKLLANHLNIYNSYDTLVELIYDELSTQLCKEGKKANYKNMLTLASNNYVRNGFFMHAFNGASLEDVLANGLDPRLHPFKKERELLNILEEYEFYATSNRLFVTTNYNILYSYGSKSPEWVYMLLKEPEIMQKRDFKKAYDSFMKKAQQKYSSPKKLNEIDAAFKKVFSYYFKKESNIQIAVIDRELKKENGKYAFNNYSFDWENDVAIDDYLKEKLELNIATKEDMQKQLLHLLKTYSLYELSGIVSLKKEQFSLISIPSHLEFEARMEQFQPSLEK